MIPFFLHEPHQQDQAYERVDVQLRIENQKRDEGAQPGQRQGRKDGDRVDEAFVEDPKDDVDDRYGHCQQQPKVFDRRLEHLGRALEARGDGGRQRERARAFNSATASPSA